MKENNEDVVGIDSKSITPDDSVLFAPEINGLLNDWSNDILKVEEGLLETKAKKDNLDLNLTIHDLDSNINTVIKDDEFDKEPPSDIKITHSSTDLQIDKETFAYTYLIYSLGS